MISPETTDDILAEIPKAITELTRELREVRVALNSINELLEDVIDRGAGEKFPGYIRTGERSHE
jgi:hypothetical protein